MSLLSLFSLGCPGKPCRRGRVITVDLLVLSSVDQLLLKMQILTTFYNTSYLNVEVNRTEPSLSVSVPWFTFRARSETTIRLDDLTSQEGFQATRLNWKGSWAGMVEIEDRVNIEIEIYRIKIFLKISKSIFIKSKLCQKYWKYKTIKIEKLRFDIFWYKIKPVLFR